MRWTLVRAIKALCLSGLMLESDMFLPRSHEIWRLTRKDASHTTFLLRMMSESKWVSCGTMRRGTKYIIHESRFGYASDETSDCIPLTHSIATRLGKKTLGDACEERFERMLIHLEPAFLRNG